LDVTLKVVGVQLDQARHEQVTMAVDSPARNTRAVRDISHCSALNDHLPDKGLVRQNNLGIGEYRLVCHGLVTLSRQCCR